MSNTKKQKRREVRAKRDEETCKSLGLKPASYAIQDRASNRAVDGRKRKQFSRLKVLGLGR